MNVDATFFRRPRSRLTMHRQLGTISGMARMNSRVYILIFLLLAAGVILWTSRKPARATSSEPPGARIVGSARFPLTVVDALDHQLTIARPPRRIISLAPGVTEILFAIDAGARVIADTSDCQYPPAARVLPKIGGFQDPSVEKIAALTPDLIIGERGNSQQVLDRLTQRGLPVMVVDPTSLPDVERTMLLFGKITGETESAHELLVEFQGRRHWITGRSADLLKAQRPRTLLLFSLDDNPYTAGPHTCIDGMIHLAGGTNIAASAATRWPQLTTDAAVAADPQVLLLLKRPRQKSPHPPNRPRPPARRRPLAHRHAVKCGRVEVLDDALLTIPGPRLADGLEATARAIHPELYVPQVVP